MQGSSDSNRTMVALKPYPKSNKDRLFNESAKYVNELGGKFTATATRSGGQVHSVVSALCDVIWTVDNRMSRFVDLSGGPNLVPSFLYLFGQEPGIDGLSNRTFWIMFVRKKSK